MPRLLPRMFDKPALSLAALALPPIRPKAGTRSTCRLPINLRNFLAAQLGCQPEASDDIILSFAASADRATLNKLARAIRRYSTARAHEAWTECNLAVESFVQARQRGCLVVLCLRCARVDFADSASSEHRRSGCVPITLVPAGAAHFDNAGAEEVPEKIQRTVEEFRALRMAFGLPHFDLDCYVRNEQLTLMWRPLP